MSLYFSSPSDLIASELLELSPTVFSVVDFSTPFKRLAEYRIKDLVIFGHLMK